MHFIKSEYGGYLLVHNGFIYLNKKVVKPRNKTRDWICEERLKDGNGKEKCRGEVTINETNHIVQEIRHNGHEPSERVAGIEYYSNYKDLLSSGGVEKYQIGNNICHDGFTYIVDGCNNIKDKTYYRCAKVNKCPGRAILAEGLIEVTIQHNHTGDDILTGN